MNSIGISVTSACNLKCLHCFQNNDRNRREELPIQKLTEVINFVKEKGYKSIIFSGGEFFMHPDAQDILKCALDKTDAEITIQNNGTKIDTTHFVNSFGKYNNRLILSFSIDGLQKDHDKRRGKNTFDKIIYNNSLLQKSGFRTNAIITIDSHNYLYLADLIDFVADTFTSLALSCIGNIGAACENEQYLGLADEGLKETLRFVYTNPPSKQTNSNRCNIFPGNLSIKYDGTVYPCGFARDMDVFPMGNIMINNIQDVIKKFCDSPDGQEIIRFENKKLIQECAQCEKISICTQGCRIRAKKAFNNLMKPDPFACFIYKNEYNEKSASDIFWGNV